MADENHMQKGLAEKLDKELDEHIEAMLEKNKGYRYKDGLSEENFEEELRRIPLFADEITQEDIDNSPELQAMQAIKYESEDPHEAALAHKDDGNHNFQKKNYRHAIISYTEAIKEKHTDMLLYATLYTNRAAANFHLGNNGSALKDAMRALHYKPGHMKALLRCAVCCFDLEKYDDCVSWCERGLGFDNNETKLHELMKKATHQRKQKERDMRKEENKKIKDLGKRNRLVAAIEERNINIESILGAKSKRGKIENLLSTDGSPHSGKLYLDKNTVLHWPVYLLYPEYSQSDFIEDFNETHTFQDHLCIVFEILPEWDVERRYTLENVEIYFEDKLQNKIIHVNPNISLRRVLSDPRYLLRGGCPAFMIMSRTTEFYKKYASIRDAEEFD